MLRSLVGSEMCIRDRRTYANLLGHLGESPTVWAECLFVDPVADIAVVGKPDSQSLYAENEAYYELMPDIPLAIADSCMTTN